MSNEVIQRATSLVEGFDARVKAASADSDEILKQTAAMMRKSVREHDLVARIGGDEFAVVFWDKEGPRTPREPRPGVVSRPPHSPVQVFERFKRLIQSEQFTALGQHGRGKLGISAGLAGLVRLAVITTDVSALAGKAWSRGATPRVSCM